MLITIDSRYEDEIDFVIDVVGDINNAAILFEGWFTDYGTGSKS